MNWQEFEQKFPIQLNTQQKEAVQSVDGPVLLLAVPGPEDYSISDPPGLYGVL